MLVQIQRSAQTKKLIATQEDEKLYLPQIKPYCTSQANYSSGEYAELFNNDYDDVNSYTNTDQFINGLLIDINENSLFESSIDLICNT
ncbi:hypothetical protein I4U23_004768 [Adineta vaga]|nr:hypothetical protein I4U23_004768 [Adineta vaga]